MTSSERLVLDHLIDRPLLCAELDKAFNRRLSLIVAQAGAGKSTLLRQWSDAHPERAFAFLDIESADDDPVHFIRRLVANLAVVEPALTEVSQLMSTQNMGLEATVIATMVAALETMVDVVIVVDDAQRLTNVHLVTELVEFVEQMPHNVHLVVSSRSDPPIALSKYRLNDELLELRQAELAFSDREAAELLERIAGHPLSSFNVRALRARTEGWAAGLQLAGLNLRHEDDPDAFVAEFGGSDRLVADYLGEEVLASMPTEQRELLLQMSVLDDMCAGLVHAVTGCDAAQAVLEQLQRDSMFLVQLDTRREWFRFHHLFRELLRSRLHAENGSNENRILGVAADWLLARGRTKSAVEYLLRAGLWQRALEVILSDAVDIAEHGDILTVARWMLRIPESARSSYAYEELLPGVLELMSDSSVGSELMPQLAFADQTGVSSTTLSGMGFFAAQMILTRHPQIAAAAAWRQLRERENNDDAYPAATNTVPTGTRQEGVIRRQALVASGRTSFLAGEMDRARSLLIQSLAEVAPNDPERVSGLSTLSLLEAWCGNIERAETLICEAVLAASKASTASEAAMADAGLASVLTALGRAEKCTAFTVESLRLPGLHEKVLADASTVLFDRAMSLLTRGDLESARGIVSSWAELIPEPEPLSVVQGHILFAWLAASDNKPDLAKRQLTEAVRVAEIHGLVRVFLRAGPSTINRLNDVAGPQAAFRDIILARAQESMDPHQRPGLPEPLTDRELEILTYLPTRFTNVELAAHCFVSVNTIKTHMVHIYRKLDATNRDSAIGRARVLGLL